MPVTPSQIPREASAPTRNAVRKRRYRSRQRDGVRMISFPVDPSIVTALVAGGWLDERREGDKEAIRIAMVNALRSLPARKRNAYPSKWN